MLEEVSWCPRLVGNVADTNPMLFDIEEGEKEGKGEDVHVSCPAAAIDVFKQQHLSCCHQQRHSGIDPQILPLCKKGEYLIPVFAD